MEFKSFEEIKRLNRVQMTITQKIHGSNAQVVILPLNTPNTPVPLIDGWVVRAGSRNRWIYPHDDNYGFATWVQKNEKELIEKLGPGTHYGEWAGPGINSGEGLTEKTFVLFDVGRYNPENLPPQTALVPVLYQGPVDTTKVREAMLDLRVNGSRLSPGFYRTEGVVVQIGGKRYKEVFQEEETRWSRPSGVKNSNPRAFVDFGHLCQPLRLEKLLSRDEAYLRGFPETLPQIVKDYVADLIKEEQIVGTEDEVKSIKKGASGQIFKFVRTFVEESLK